MELSSQGQFLWQGLMRIAWSTIAKDDYELQSLPVSPESLPSAGIAGMCHSDWLTWWGN